MSGQIWHVESQEFWTQGQSHIEIKPSDHCKGFGREETGGWPLLSSDLHLKEKEPLPLVAVQALRPLCRKDMDAHHSKEGGAYQAGSVILGCEGQASFTSLMVAVL
jgi:hypothetical protein